MATTKTLWYMLPRQLKEIFNNLIDKIQEENCFDTTEIERLRDKTNWYNTPNVINEAIVYLEDLNYPSDIEKPQWHKLPNTIDKLNLLAENFDCSNVIIPEDVATIRITQRDETGDLCEPNTSVDINLYFEDTDLDNTPQVGDILYTNPTLRTEFMEEGAYYFVKPSDESTEISLTVNSNGSVTDVNFEVICE